MDLLEGFEQKARGGDGTFAVAYAILKLAHAQQDTARALDKLGFNDKSPSGPPGTTEKIAMVLEQIAQNLNDR